MFKFAIWFGSVAMLSLVVGPVTVVGSLASQLDAADLYIVIGAGGSSLSQASLKAYDATSVGPVNGLLAAMVHAPVSSREHLLQAGYIMIPAGKLATFCRLESAANTPSRSS